MVALFMIELRPSLSGLRHHAVRLITVLAGKRTVTLQCLLTGEAQLVFPCAVSGDLRRPGAAPPLLLEVVFYLLPSWTARFNIFVAVPFDFRRAILPRSVSYPRCFNRWASSD